MCSQLCLILTCLVIYEDFLLFASVCVVQNTKMPRVTSGYSKKKAPRKAMRGKFVYKRKYTPRKVARSKMRREYAKLYENSCGKKYLQAVLYPFSAAARGACVPSTPAPDSQKGLGRIVVNAIAGPNGIIQVMLAPSVASNHVSMYVYGGGALTPTVNSIQIQDTSTALYPGWRIHAATQLPFNIDSLTPGGDAGDPSAQLMPDVQGRLVSVGCSIRYTGREDAMSGTITGFVSPDHNNINEEEFANINTRVTAERKPVSRAGMSLRMAAINSQELEYGNNMRNNNAGSYSFGYWQPWCMYNLYQPLITQGGVIGGFIVTGLQPDSSMEIEYISHVEYTGRGIQSASSNSPDALARQKAQEAATDTPILKKE